MRIRVFAVDDHHVALSGLRDQMQLAGFQLVGTASTGKNAIEQLKTLQVDVILIDVRLEDMDGLAILESVRECFPDIPVVMFSAYDNPTYVARAVALGASEYILKTADSRTTKLAIEAAHRRDPAHPDGNLARVDSLMRHEVDAAKLPRDMPLTGREAQVLKHLALGLSNKEIAQSLSISVETVKEHVQNVLRKIKAKDRTDAAVRAIRSGMFEM
jgi:DNA-binding NarL/FixJ family response regulator